MVVAGGFQVVVAVGFQGRVDAQVVVAVGSQGRVDAQPALGKKRHSLKLVHLPLMGRTVDSIHLLI